MFNKNIFILVGILMALIYANCASPKTGDNSAALLLVAGSSSDDDDDGPPAVTDCTVNRQTPKRNAAGQIIRGQFNQTTSLHKLFTAVTEKQEIFTKASKTDADLSTYVKIEAKQGTVLTTENYAQGVGAASAARSITVYKNFTNCDDKDKPFDLFGNNVTTTAGLQYTEAGSTTSPRTFTFKIKGTYLLQYYAPGGHGRGPEPLKAKQAVPTIQITKE